MPKLHRRVFLDGITKDELRIYISFYIEAINRDTYMATKQEIFFLLYKSCKQHGAQLASNRRQIVFSNSVDMIPPPQRGPAGNGNGTGAMRLPMHGVDPAVSNSIPPDGELR